MQMILKYYGKYINIETLRKATRKTTTGVSMLGLADAAESYGLRTLCVRLSADQLIRDVPLPCVLYWDDYHYVVLTPGSGKKRFKIADPARGLVTYSREKFLDHWLNTDSNGDRKGVALLFETTPAFKNIEEDKLQGLGWGRIAVYCLRFKPQLLQLILGLFIGSLLTLIFPFLTRSIVDTGIGTGNIGFVEMILLAQFVLFFSRAFVDFIRSRMLLFISSHVNLALLSDFWIKLMRLPLSFFETRQTGDIMQRLADHNRIQIFITGTALQTMFSIMTLLVFLVVLFKFDVTIFLIFVGASALYLLWIRLFLHLRRNIDQTRFNAASKESSLTMEFIHGMHEIKLNNAEQIKRWQWEKIQARLFSVTYRTLSMNQNQQAGAFFINEGNEILNDHSALRMEQQHYQPLPMVREVTPAMVQSNYLQIKQDVENLVMDRIGEMMNDPVKAALIIKKPVKV